MAGADRARPRPRVLVTRTLEQAGPLCDLLAAAGFDPVLLPTIDVEPVEDSTALDAAISRLSTYDWIVFPSANAVRFFVARLEVLGVPVAACAAARLVAGPRTARLLRGYGLPVAVEPAPFSAEAACAAMQSALIPGARVLLLRAAGGREALGAGLRTAGAIMDEVALYRTIGARVPAGRAGSDVLQQLEAGDVAALTFFSPSAVEGFASRAGAGASAERLADVLDGVTIACIGPTTAAAVERHGWHVDVIPPDTTADSLVAALRTRLVAGAGRSGR